MILPLANRRDKCTQVLWGIRDFEHRFGRKPEGMWLPETAVDIETLDVLAEQGIQFTILSPSQAKPGRRIGERLAGCQRGRIDPSMAYSVRLPSGRTIALFFYDGPVSHGGGIRRSAGQRRDASLSRLMGGFRRGRDRAQLDPHRDRRRDVRPPSPPRRHGAGLRAQPYRDEASWRRLTNYGEYPRATPADPRGRDHREKLVELRPRRRALARGLRLQLRRAARLESAAGAQPLRNALDWLRDKLAPVFEGRRRELSSRTRGPRATNTSPSCSTVRDG